MTRPPRVLRAPAGARLAAALVTTLVTTLGAGVASAEHIPDDGPARYLVTLDGPGLTGGHLEREDLLAAQDATLALVGAADPLYRFTTALNGYAVDLDEDQAGTLAAAPGVARVEPDAVHRVAGRPTGATLPSVGAAGRGGRGVVVGVVDTGISPDSPAFADVRGLGPVPREFLGACPEAEHWETRDCNGKLVGARHFVAGFGEDGLGSGARLSPLDDDGHGTQVASLAVGNDGVVARDRGQTLGRFSGMAPDARVAAYKACWVAPDPDDDGCATSDVVAAIDQAVADGVDVLSVAVTGSPDLDTVDLALLGAAEHDVFVAVPAGNGTRTVGHVQPWTTTVGSVTGPRRTGRLVFADGSSVTGAMTARTPVPAARLVAAGSAPAAGYSRAEAALCLPGSLDVRRTAGRIVVCQRGTVARVDKSSAVALADGVAMVLVNGRGQGVTADFHDVPTLHVSAADGAAIRRRLRAPGPLTGSLERVRVTTARPRLMPWSPRGDRSGSSLKPDLVAPGSAMLGATSPSADTRSWNLLSGTSASTAIVAGVAARVRAAHPGWSATRVQSALMTSATDAAGHPDALAQGAGVVSPAAATRPVLAYDVDAALFRAVLEGRLDVARLNLPSAVVDVARRPVTITRTVTNLSSRHRYFSSSATGFERHRVVVTPAAIRIGPGETRTYRVETTPLTGLRSGAESGSVTWRGADGTVVRIPLVLR
jgi:minor extracellular serine protease Vpr